MAIDAPAAVLSRVSSAGCDLPAEHELHGAAGAVQDPREALRVPEDEIRPFVTGEPPGKADREGVGIEQCAGGEDPCER